MIHSRYELYFNSTCGRSRSLSSLFLSVDFAIMLICAVNSSNYLSGSDVCDMKTSTNIPGTALSSRLMTNILSSNLITFSILVYFYLSSGFSNSSISGALTHKEISFVLASLQTTQDSMPQDLGYGCCLATLILFSFTQSWLPTLM